MGGWMTRKSPAEAEQSLVSLGASLQFTFCDRLLIRACAGFIAVLASATALFAQAADFGERVLPSSSQTRVDPAFTSGDEVFQTSETISSTTRRASPTPPDPLA